MELIKLQLFSKNNKRNGSYLYTPIVKLNNLFYWCESIKSKTVLKCKDLKIENLIITREIPVNFYQQNKLI